MNGRVVHVMSDPEGNGYRARREVPFGTAIDVPGAGGTLAVT